MNYIAGIQTSRDLRRKIVTPNPPRYPENIVLVSQDFIDSEWKLVLATTTREGYSAMWQGFSAAARKAIEEGHQNQGKALWLLADACSMMLKPSSINEPFKPFMVVEGKRSVVADDFSEEDIVFFSQIVDEIDDPWLKGRLADLVWLKNRSLGFKFALAAIDAYRMLPLDVNTWVRGGRECWERTISLAKMLKAGAGDRVEKITEVITATFEAAKIEDGFLALWLADMLEENHLGHKKAADIAEKLGEMAGDFDSAGDLHRAREFYDASARWFKASGDEAKAAEMMVKVAEGWVKEAITRVSTEQPSYMVAASFYERAIQVYRTIPRGERAIHRVDERMVELRTHLSDAGDKSLGEMGVITTPGIDLTEIVEHARNSVRGKSILDALKAFANLHRGVRAAELRKSALEQLRQFSLHSLFPATIMSRDGRVIAKRPGLSLAGGTPSDEDEVVIRSEMSRNYLVLVSIIFQGDIWPALEVLHIEHRLQEDIFINLAKESPIVPPGRELLFGKALFAGYDHDFITALHLLVPQIEHMVRWHLKCAGVKTTNLDMNGIENENGLSTLMELTETAQIFGEDIAFEINALFCDPFGPNLRNEMAHGLLDHEACQSVPAVYAWWLTLRLVFLTYWSRVQKTQETAAPSPAAPSSEVLEEGVGKTVEGQCDPGEVSP